MLNKIKLLFDLSRFEGGAAAGGAAATSGTGEGGTAGGTQATPSVAGKGKTGGTQANVLYGKQPQAAAQSAEGSPSVAGEGETTDTTKAQSPEERRKAYRDLMEGEYKDLHTEEMQRIINRRFKDTEDLREQNARSQEVLGILMDRYGIEDGDLGKLQKAIEGDNSYWAEAAEAAGMGVEQFKELQALKRKNAELVTRERQRVGMERAERQTQQWFTEAQALKAKFPKFDLAREVQNPQFLAMLKAGTPVEHAYKVLHFDELMGDAMTVTAAQQEQKVVAQVRARGARPAENGTASSGAFLVKDDVSKLTAKDRRRIADLALRGETISF